MEKVATSLNLPVDLLIKDITAAQTLYAALWQQSKIVVVVKPAVIYATVRRTK